MPGAEEMIRELQGNSTMTCYDTLLQAVQVACENLPAQLLMKDLANSTPSVDLKTILKYTGEVFPSSVFS